jgi:sensor histidine kinase YesM
MMMATDMRSNAWFTRLTILGCLILWMGFHVWMLNSVFEIRGEAASWDSFVFNITAIGMILVMNTIIPRVPRVGIYQLSIGLSVLLAFFSEWVSVKIVSQIVADDPAYLNFLNQSSAMRLVILFLIIGGAAFSLIFYSRWQEMAAAHTRESTTEIMAKEAELQKLQQQLQPHFLFNSLNSINALILINPSNARQMVQQLSDFLRATLSRADERWITLNQELEYLQLYLAIEKVRFGHRLEVNVEADDQIKLWLIPPLLIQPLVENAIKFGLYGTTEKVLIQMTTRRVNDALQIEIVNPFDADMQPAEGSGFGLSGLQRRLYLLYARNDLLKTSIENNHFSVQLTLPEKVWANQ